VLVVLVVQEIKKKDLRIWEECSLKKWKDMDMDIKRDN